MSASVSSLPVTMSKFMVSASILRDMAAPFCSFALASKSNCFERPCKNTETAETIPICREYSPSKKESIVTARVTKVTGMKAIKKCLISKYRPARRYIYFLRSTIRKNFATLAFFQAIFGSFLGSFPRFFESTVCPSLFSFPINLLNIVKRLVNKFTELLDFRVSEYSTEAVHAKPFIDCRETLQRATSLLHSLLPFATPFRESVVKTPFCILTLVPFLILFFSFRPSCCMRGVGK
mmetsp:Transcript_22835/g.41501  ORF Transcript_22835/g.41501 Transcript_22835/m.41501 type:complete len:236 (+) Transcript_22835:1313-2020(+)